MTTFFTVVHNMTCESSHRQTHTQTDRQTDGSDSFTTTADAGGKYSSSAPWYVYLCPPLRFASSGPRMSTYYLLKADSKIIIILLKRSQFSPWKGQLRNFPN